MATVAEARKNGKSITIPGLDIRQIVVQIEGLTPLICHRFGEKAKEEMLGTQQKKAKRGKEERKPEQEYKESLYEHPHGGYGFPSIGFKLCMVRGAKAIDLVMTDVRTSVFVKGDGPDSLVKIDGEPRMREDVVRYGGRTTDLRYRGEFPEWSAQLEIDYNAGVVSDEQVVAMINAGGFGTGVGEWRPENGGQYGRFRIAEE